MARMSLLIATDEAGYGPKLGPLVVAATAWGVPSGSIDLVERSFVPLRQPQDCGGVRVVIDDSKSVFKPGKGMQSFHVAVAASHHWCGFAEPDFRAAMGRVAPGDVAAVEQTPWLNEKVEAEFPAPSVTKSLCDRWSAEGARQLGTRLRVITAGRFNRYCEKANKAELLSESTLALVRSLLVSLETETAEDDVLVFCDRHGGRRYYAGVLQHLFPEVFVQIVHESAEQSVYRFDWDSRPVTVHFTVKGDRFTPVAFSSMHAKYVRERFMESFNRYFLRLDASGRLQPTAGYPVDADRFLADIDPIIRRERIDSESLIRSR